MQKTNILQVLRGKRLEDGVDSMCNGIVCYSHLLPVRSMWEGYAFESVYVLLCVIKKTPVCILLLEISTLYSPVKTFSVPLSLA